MKGYKPFIFLLLLLCSSLTKAQLSFTWATKVWSSNAEIVREITCDSLGNFFVVGRFSNSVNFDSSGITKTYLSFGSDDIFIAKFDCAKVLQWVNIAGSSGADGGLYNQMKAVTDLSGNVFVVFSFVGSATVTSKGSSNQVITSAGAEDIALAKYSGSGQLLWVVSSGGSDVDESGGIAIDPSGNCYIGGFISGSATIGSLSGSGNVHTSGGGMDIVVAKYNSSGALQWSTTASGPANDLAVHLSVSPAGNVFVTGNFGCCGGGSATFGSQTITNTSLWGGFIAKLNSSGAWVWVNSIGGSGDESIAGIAIDVNENVYIAGIHTGTGTFSSSPPGSGIFISNNGLEDIMIAAYRTNGVLRWAVNIGGADLDAGRSIFIDRNYNLVVAGWFSGTVTFGSNILTSSGSRDIFVMKMDTTNGNVLSAVKAGSSASDAAVAMTTSVRDNSIYVVGVYNGPISFGSTALTHSGSGDGFIARLGLSDTTILTASKSNILCANDSAILVANPANAVSYDWYLNNGLIASGTSNSMYISLSGTYKVVANYTCGQTETSNNVIIGLIGSLPSANAGMDTMILAGDSAQLLASGGTTYSWSPSTGLSNPNIANPKAAPSATIQYIVTVTNGLCSGQDTVLVTVVPRLQCINCSTASTINLGLVACYPFNNNPNDASGNSRHGTASNIGYVTDRFGNVSRAGDFNGSTSLFSIPSSSMQLNTYSYSGWVKVRNYPAVSGTANAFISIGNATNGDQVVLFCKDCPVNGGGGTVTSGVTATSYFNSGGPPDLAVTPGFTDVITWHHVVLVRNVATMKLQIYLDGTLRETVSLSNASAFYGVTTGFIGSRVGGGQVFDGYIDDVRIYNRVLSQAEILQLFSLTDNPVTASAGNDTAIIVGDSAQLLASGGTSYVWSPATGLSNAGIANPKASPVNTTTYVVTVSNGSCTAKDTIVVTVNPVPLPCNTCISSIPANAGLIACYPLDGNANNAAGNAFNGTIEGAVNAADRFGRSTSAYSFNGTNQRIRLGDILDTVFAKAPVARFSISGWAKTDAWAPWSGGGIIIGKESGGSGNEYQFRINHDNDGRVGALVVSDAVGGNYIGVKSPVIPTGQWFHYVMVFDGSLPEIQRVKLYVNKVPGSLDLDNGTLGTTTTNTVQELNIGSGHMAGDPSTPVNLYAGTIDNIKIFNRALSLSDIISLYNEKASFANAGNDTTIFAGDSARLIATGGTSYAWSPSTGLSNANIANPKASPAATTTYIVTVTNANCTEKDTVIVTVVPPTCDNCLSVNSINNGLLACYPLKGNAGDESGHGNIGTPSGVLFTNDRFGNLGSSGLFNGSAARIDVSPTAFQVNTYSYSAWINAAVLPGSGSLYSILSVGSDIADQFIMLTNEPAASRVGFGYGSYFNNSTPGPVPDRYFTGSLPSANTWHHITLTRTTATLKFYVDGTLVDTRPVSHTDAAYGTGSVLRIGARSGSAPVIQHFNGRIDDVRIYDRAISDAEVSQLYAIRPALGSVSISNDTTIIAGDSAQLIATGGGTYSWAPSLGLSNPGIANPKAGPAITTRYIVTITNGNCITKDTVVITVTTPVVQSCSYTDLLLIPDLIPNGNFSSGNTGFTSNQNYSSAYAPCNYYVGNAWFNSSPATDHTPTADNMFMSIDGCGGSSTVIYQTTVPVTSLTNHKFSFWATRSGVAQPNFEIHFIGNITGDLLAATIAGVPNTGVEAWDEYTAPVWSSGANTSVTIKIINLETAGFGNDFGLDDVSLKICNLSSVSPVCLNCSSIDTLNNSLVACYPFNGNADDESGHGNNGTVSSGASLITDRSSLSNRAYTFNGGANAFINVPASASLNTNTMNGLTMSCWFNAVVPSPVIPRRIIQFQDGSARNYELSYDFSNNRLSYINFAGSSAAINILSKQVFTPGTWYHVAVRITGLNSTEIYVNGVLDTFSTNAIVKPINPVFSIGRHVVNGWNFSGKIDDVRIYNRSLSVNEIAQLGQLFDPVKAYAGIDTVVCSGDSVRLSATGGGAYRWTPAGTLNNDSIFNPYAKPVSTTEYIVTVTDGICSVRDTVKVTVDTPVNANGGTDQNLCNGDSIQLTASGGAKYKWAPSGTVSNDTLSNPYVKPTVTTDYIVTVTSGGCKDKDTVRVSVSSVTADAGVVQSICSGDSVQLTATGGTQYSWLNNGTLSDTAIANPYAKPSITTLYTVQVSDGICTKQDTVTVIVGIGGTLNAGTDKTICEKDSVQLSVTGGGNYTWSPNIGMNDTTSATPKVSPPVTTEYMVVSTVGSCVARDTVIVNVNTLPAISAGLDVIVCKDIPYPVPAISSNANQYLWTPSTFLDDATLLQPVVTANNTTQYIIKATNSTTSCANYDTLLVTVSAPVASFTATPLTGTIPFDVQFTNTSIASNPTYTWYFEDVDSFYNDEHPRHTYKTRGEFRVLLTVTDENGCIDTSSMIIEALDELKIFIPNVFTPNGDSINDYFVIWYTEGALDKMTGTIWNRWGAKIYEFEMPNGEWWDGTENGQICSDGVYFYIVQAKDHQGRIKKYHGTVTLLR